MHIGLSFNILNPHLHKAQLQFDCVHMALPLYHESLQVLHEHKPQQQYLHVHMAQQLYPHEHKEQQQGCLHPEEQEQQELLLMLPGKP